MKITPLSRIETGQDGVVYGGYLFRFDHRGRCFVYSLEELQNSSGNKCSYIFSFMLDKADILAPHSNSVSFGNEYYKPDDEFPLLYTNIYNNYSSEENQRKGITAVYRIEKNHNSFSSTLVQLIEVDFTEDTFYWASEHHEDKRPYGNIAIDGKNGIYYAFTMRDRTRTCRYFSFPLPKCADGIIDDELDVHRVRLGVGDIMDYFDCEYHHFLQGACFNNGCIYSLEGFTDNASNPPAMRIIDTVSKQQVFNCKFADFGLNIEPEFIDFADGVCYYADCDGNLYTINFS